MIYTIVRSEDNYPVALASDIKTACIIMDEHAADGLQCRSHASFTEPNVDNSTGHMWIAIALAPSNGYMFDVRNRPDAAVHEIVEYWLDYDVPHIDVERMEIERIVA